jgi:hypothetical protein
LPAFFVDDWDYTIEYRCYERRGDLYGTSKLNIAFDSNTTLDSNNYQLFAL